MKTRKTMNDKREIIRPIQQDLEQALQELNKETGLEFEVYPESLAEWVTDECRTEEERCVE